MCAVVMNNATTAFVGFYGVEPEYQGFGVGRALWAKTFARLDDGLNVGLYGVPDMAHKYKRAGFIIEDSIDMLIYESQPGQKIPLDTLSDLTLADGTESATPATATSYKLVVIDANCSECLFNKLTDYDARVVGYSRQTLLRKYLIDLHEADLLTLAILRVRPLTTGANDDDELVGYGCVRADNNSGAMIGPLYSDCPKVAETLLKHLLLGFPLAEAKIYSVMPLSSNQTAVGTLERCGFTKLDTCSRLFKKFVPAAKFEKIHYVLSPNFSLF